MGMLELPEEEVPPERYWHHSERLHEWFRAVRYHRMHPNESSPFKSDDDDYEPTVKTMRNTLVDDLMSV